MMRMALARSRSSSAWCAPRKTSSRVAQSGTGAGGSTAREGKNRHAGTHGAGARRSVPTTEMLVANERLTPATPLTTAPAPAASVPGLARNPACENDGTDNVGHDDFPDDGPGGSAYHGVVRAVVDGGGHDGTAEHERGRRRRSRSLTSRANPVAIPLPRSGYADAIGSRGSICSGVVAVAAAAGALSMRGRQHADLAARPRQPSSSPRQTSCDQACLAGESPDRQVRCGLGLPAGYRLDGALLGDLVAGDRSGVRRNAQLSANDKQVRPK